MPLTNIAVDPVPEPDFTILVRADYGQERIIAHIGRLAIDDYFGLTGAGDDERIAFVEEHKEVIGKIMAAKYESGAYRKSGSATCKVDISTEDLRRGL